MKKIRLTLKEDEEFMDGKVTEIDNEEVTEEPTEENLPEEVEEEEGQSFIVSDELNEIRDILLDIPDEIELLLLNDELVILGNVIDTDTFVYTLPEDSEEFELIKLPMKLEEIYNNDDIIKYSPDKIDDRHNKVVDLLMSKLENAEEVV